MGREEDKLTIESSMALTDWFRTIQNGSSRRISLEDMLASSVDELEDLGFLTASTIGSGVQNKQVVTEVATTYTLLTTDSVVLVDVSGGDVTINLMAVADAWDSANSKGQVFTIKLDVASGGNKVILDANGSELIDGNATYELIGASLLFVSIITNGTSWRVIGG